MRLFFILLVLVALILGPIMMLRPNVGQKRKERLRSLARTRGVHFSMRNLPKLADEAEQQPASPVYFIAPQSQQFEPNWLLQKASYEHEAHFLGWWVWQRDIRASEAEQGILTHYIPRLPTAVKAISGGGQGAAVYWDESGDETQLELIIELLDALNATRARPT